MKIYINPTLDKKKKYINSKLDKPNINNSQKISVPKTNNTPSERSFSDKYTITYEKEKPFRQSDMSLSSAITGKSFGEQKFESEFQNKKELSLAKTVKSITYNYQGYTPVEKLTEDLTNTDNSLRITYRAVTGKEASGNINPGDIESHNFGATPKYVTYSSSKNINTKKDASSIAEKFQKYDDVFYRALGDIKANGKLSEDLNKKVKEYLSDLNPHNFSTESEKAIAAEYQNIYSALQNGSYAGYFSTRYALGAASPVANVMAGGAIAIKDAVALMAGKETESDKIKRISEYFSENPEKKYSGDTFGIAQEIGNVSVNDVEAYKLETIMPGAREAFERQFGNNLNDKVKTIGGGLAETAGAFTSSMLMANALGGVSGATSNNGLIGNIINKESFGKIAKDLFAPSTMSTIYGLSTAGGEVVDLAIKRGYDPTNIMVAGAKGYTEMVGENISGLSDAKWFDANNTANILFKFGINGLEEGLEEGFTAVTQNFIDKALVDKNKPWVGSGGVFDASELATTFVTSFIFGEVMGSVKLTTDLYAAAQEGSGSQSIKIKSELSRINQTLPEHVRPNIDKMNVRSATKAVQKAQLAYLQEISDELDKSSQIYNNSRKILNFAMQNSALGSDMSKQASFETMSQKGYTPGTAFLKRIESVTKTTLSESGLDADTIQNIEALIDKLDTGFASAWFGGDGVTSAREAAVYYTRGANVGDIVTAAIIANKTLENANLSTRQKAAAIKKANKFLPMSHKISTKSGTTFVNAIEIIDNVNDYLSEALESVSEIGVSQDYKSNMVGLINDMINSNPELNSSSKSALTDLLLNGQIASNIESILADSQATEVLSEFLGINIDEKTTVAEVIRKCKDALSVYRSGHGDTFSRSAIRKTALLKQSLELLNKNNITDASAPVILRGFRNVILNGKITEEQARAIVENDVAFELYKKITDNTLSLQSTLQDVIDAAGDVAGFRINGEIAEFTDVGIKEIVESDTLVPDGEIGIYDSDTGKIILNSKATQEQKNAYILAHRILTESKKTDNIDIKGVDNNGDSTDPGILERGEVSTSDRRNYSLRKQGTNSAKITEYLGNVEKEKGRNISEYRAGESGWMVQTKSAQSDISGSQESVFRTISEIKPSGQDTIGRILSEELCEIFQNSVFKDENGNLLSLYHWTKEVFTTFTKGEFGFHFGTLDAARDRYIQLKEQMSDIPVGNYKEVYLNVTNPIELNDESGVWDAAWVAYQLKDKGIITEQEFKSLENTIGFYDDTYDNPAAEAVRNILKQNGYDGIIYKNLSEDKGSMSVITLYPEQIITVAENGIDIIDTATYDPDFRLDGSGKLHFEGDKGKLSELQRGSIKALELLADTIGIDIYIETDVNKNINGWLDFKGIHISLEAGQDAKGTLLFTAAHELTHFIKEHSPKKWEMFAEFIIQNYVGKDISVGELIIKQQEKAKKNGIALSPKQAQEEVIADACETMLIDGTAMEKLSELRKQDVGLFERIKYFLSNLAAKIKKLYEGLKPDSVEARYISEMNDTAAKLQQMFNDALFDATIKYQTNTESVSENIYTKYSFNDTSTGMANDMLLPYDEELKNIIESKDGFIIDSYDKLVEVVNLAFDDPKRKGTAYFGMLKPEILSNIEQNIPNKPKDLKENLFKENRQYSIAVTLDSIRHIVDDKSLSRQDVIDYLDRLADVIIDFDSVTFDYYYANDNQKHKGVLFKKQFSDGITQTFNAISNKSKSLRLITIYLEQGAYKKRKSAKTLPMQNVAPAHTLEAGASQTFNNKVSQSDTVVNSNSIQEAEDDTYFSFKSTPVSLSERVLEYIIQHKGVDELSNASVSKYSAYMRDVQWRISSSILSPENLNNEIAADFLAKLFVDKALMEELAQKDLSLAVELAERVAAFSKTNDDKKLIEFSRSAYSDLYSVISAEEYANELEVILKERTESGQSTVSIDESASEGKVNMNGVADKKFIHKIQDWWHDAKRGVVDSGEAIKRLSDKLGNETIYHLYNNSKQSKQSVNIMLTKWQTDIEGNKIGESLKEIFLPIVKDSVKYRNFCLYMQYLNNSERALHDKAIFPDVSREESLRRADSLVSSNPEFKEWQDKVYKYIDGLLGWQLDSGLISQEQYDGLKATNKYYVPALLVQNVNTDKPFFYENVMISKGVSRAKGGGMETMPLLEALTLKTTQIVNEARMNKLATEMINTLKVKGLLSETIDGFEVSDAALQEFIYHVTATKKANGFAPERINGIYTTPEARRKLIQAISGLFTFSEGNKNSAATIIRDYAQSVTLSETFDKTEVESLINKLLSLAIVPEATADAPYYTYPELRRMLKDTRIYVSPEIVSEIPDYSAFSKSAFGRLRLTTKQESGTIDVDSIYQELSLMHPDIFNPDIANPTDRLYAIHKAATETLKKPDNVSMLEYYKDNISEMRSDLISRISDDAISAIKAAHKERVDISEKAEQSTAVEYDPESTDNFSFNGEQEGNRMAFYIDGARYTADIGRGIFEGLKHIDYVPDANRALIPLKAANSLFKKLVTSYNPFFSIRNFVRDLQDAVMYSTDAPRMLLNLPKAYKEMASGGEMWKLYQSLGGVGSSYFDFKGEMDLASSMDIKSKAVKAGQKVVNFFEYINQAVEQAPRLAEFMTVLKKGDGSYASKMKALYAAADVTVNFGRAGIYSKFLNSTIVPFFNPGVQGASKFVRMFSERKGAKQWIFLAAKLLVLGFACGAINDLINHDDEDYEKLTDFQKQSNILIKIGDGRFLKIPKGRTINVFGITSQSIKDTVSGEDVDWLGVLKTASDQIAPNNPITDNLIMPFVNAVNNKTWYGGEIESAADENVKPEQRFDETTDYFSRWLGDVLNYSPKKINYMLDAYSGVVGDYTLPLLTPQGSGGVIQRTMLTAGANFIVDSKTSNRISNDYYSLIDELTFEKNDINVEDNLAATVSLRFLNSQTKTLYDFYDELHQINSGDLSPNEKAAKSREVKVTVSGLMLNAMDSQKVVYETAQKIKSKYAYQRDGKYFDEAGDEITYEKYIDIITREVYKDVFGAEYALKSYNKNVYAKASEAVAMGATYDLYYDAYFDVANIEGDIDTEKGDIKTGSARKNKWKHIDSMNASQSERAAVAKVLFDIQDDKLDTATASGISMYEYIDFICDTGTYKSDDKFTKKDKVLAYINMMQLSDKQKDTLYLLAGYSKKKIYNAPWH